MPLTYKRAGVDIIKAELFKQKIRPWLRKSFSKEVLKDMGGFGSLFEFPQGKFREPVLVSSSDGVGTKLKIAILVNIHDTIGIDLVAMNVNDILCTGAKPLFFLDYIAFSKLEEDVLIDIVKGINNGCIQAGCSLIGGETAQVPGMYKKGDYDVAGFCVGVVEKKNIIDGSQIAVGDTVIGLESNGLHSNGFSLVRKIFSKNELKRMNNELLKPTRIYVKPILSLLRTTHDARERSEAEPPRRGRTTLKGIAHITGGAFYDKIARILPDNINVRINKNSWIVPKIFKLIQNKGNLEDKEMFHTFNMGVGIVLVADSESTKFVISKLAEFKLKSWVIGRVVKGGREVEII